MLEINITIFNPLRAYGGLEIATTKLGRELQARNFRVDVVVLPDSRVESLARSLDLEVKPISLKQEYFNFSSAIRLSKIFNLSDTDLSVVGKSSLLSTVIMAKKLSRKKPVIVFHQQMQSGVKKKDIIHNWIYRNLDGVVVLNNRMKQDILQTTIIDPSKVKVIPYGIDINKFRPMPEKKIELRKSFNLPVENFLVGCIGRIDRQKGQDVLLDAFMSLRNIDKIKLVIAGDPSDRIFFDELQNLIKAHYMEERVVYIPFTNKVPELMNCFDLLVVPSHCETFGLVVIEGMACGLSVLGTDCGGIPEIIDSGKNGFIFPPRNSSDLAELITMLYQDRDLMKEIGKNAREKVEQNFDRDIEVNNIIKFYLELLSRK